MHWIEIYPVDSVIHVLNNWSQEFHNQPSEFNTISSTCARPPSSAAIQAGMAFFLAQSLVM